MRFTIDHHHYDWCFDLTVSDDGPGAVVFTGNCGRPCDDNEGIEIFVSVDQARAFAKGIMMIADEVERKAFEEMEDDCPHPRLCHPYVGNRPHLQHGQRSRPRRP